MRYSKALSSVAAIASVALAGACSRTISSTTAAGSLSPALSTNPAITSADVAMLASMSTSERLTHLAVGDSMEIAMAQVALQRSQNGAIQSFAQRMINDHTQSLQRGHLIAQQEGLALTPAPSDTSGAHLLRMVDALNNAGQSTLDFDHSYVLSQIQMHQHMLGELQTMQGMVTDEALRQHISANIPVVQAHLNSAQRLGRQLGFTTAR